MSGLTVSEFCVDRLGQPVVRDVDLEVAPGQVTVLLGANGVGKSTCLDGISGVAPARSGSVTLDGLELSRASRRKRVAAGMAYVQQGRTVFPGLTVEENLLVAAPRTRFDPVFELFPELAERVESPAALLSGGEQQMVVLGRAVLQQPKVLMIDELSLGLAPIIVDRMLDAVRRMADDGMSVLLVEQFADRALAVGDSAVVLSRGAVVLRGPAADLRRDPEALRAAYLGIDADGEVLQARRS